MNEALQEIVRKELEPLGLELFELHMGGSRNRPVLDVRIEREDGKSITVDDCARASRAIEARLDSSSFADSRYVLEVSSPGIERPLRNAADWRRFVGRDAVVTSDSAEGAPAAGSREVRIVGVEGDAGAEVAVLEDGGGTTLRIPLAAVRKARLAFNWKR
jgi:ribosome maturation factor RimP